jgi:proliferating cell nuclear antigen
MSGYALEVRTMQSSAFKTLIEAIKELLTDTCIEFDETGMKIIATDTSHIVLVHLKLSAEKFEYYHCPNRLVIGVNMLNFHKLIKTVNSNDTLTLFIDNDDMNHIGIKIESSLKNSKTTYKLNLLDLDNHKIHVPPTEFNSMITLPSTDFQKICRDMSNIAEQVEVKNVDGQLIFSCKGDFCSQLTVLSDQDGVNTIENKNDGEIVQGVFSLKYLVLFTKCTNLCNTVELFMRNDFPLIVQYACASLGTLKMALSPILQNE